MKNKKILLIIAVILIIVGLTIVFVVAMTVGRKEDKAPAFLTEHDWIRQDNCEEHISFRAGGEFSYWCTCGSPVDNYDLYDSFEYSDNVISVKGEDTAAMQVIYYDENYLCLYLDPEKECRVFVDSDYAYADYTEHDPASFVNEGWAELYVLGYNDGKLNVAPIGYDGDAKSDFEEYIRDLTVTEDVTFYSVDSIDDNGSLTTEHIKLGETEIPHIGEYYTGAFVNFDTEGKVRYVVFYGKTIIQG